MDWINQYWRNTWLCQDSSTQRIEWFNLLFVDFLSITWNVIFWTNLVEFQSEIFSYAKQPGTSTMVEFHIFLLDLKFSILHFVSIFWWWIYIWFWFKDHIIFQETKKGPQCQDNNEQSEAKLRLMDLKLLRSDMGIQYIPLGRRWLELIL